MSFRKSFERNVNDDMQDDGQPGRAPPEVEDADMAVKKGLPSPSYPIDEKAHEKNACPPRFSTLFAAPAAPPSPPPPQREYIREYYPAPQRKSGVFLPMPLFIVFAAILFLESTILFAYTVIGLYNNAPAKLFPWAGQGGAVAAACNCGPQQPAVNIAPNFIMPQAGLPLSEPVTITPSTTSTSPSSLSTSTSVTSTSASTEPSSTTTSTTVPGAAQAASDVAGILAGLELTTASAIRGTVTSVKVITVDPPSITRSTSSTTIFIDPTTTDTITDAAATISSTTDAGTSASSVDPAAEADSTSVPLGGITVIPTTLESSATPAPTV